MTAFQCILGSHDFMVKENGSRGDGMVRALGGGAGEWVVRQVWHQNASTALRQESIQPAGRIVSDVLENRLVTCRVRTARGEQSGLLALSDGISPSSPSCSLSSVHAGLHAVSPTLLRAFALAPPTAWPGFRWICLRLTTLPASGLCSNVLFSVRVILTTSLTLVTCPVF